MVVSPEAGIAFAQEVDLGAEGRPASDGERSRWLAGSSSPRSGRGPLE